MASCTPENDLAEMEEPQPLKNESCLTEGPDFTDLPDVIWVRVMTYLNLEQRSFVAQTCHKLADIFNHPSLWHTVKIVLLGDTNRYAVKAGVLVPNKYIQLVKRFGAYFQDLTLIFHGYLHKIPPECKEVILQLSEKCRLQSLHLSVGTSLTKDTWLMDRPSKQDLKVLLTFLSNAFRLQEFYLHSWPMYPRGNNIDILDALRNNPKIQNMEKLSLFYINARSSTWTTLNAMLPSPESAFKTIKNLSYLNTLNLRSTLLTEALIEELAKRHRVPLQNFGILVTKSHMESIPEISSQAWEDLKRHSPDLQVHFTVAARISFMDLAGLMKLEIPVASVDFMKYSRCGSQDVQSITDKYHRTLKRFTCYADPVNLDSDLIQLVTKCSELIYFVFHGSVKHSTVLKLAKLRGSQWYHLEFMTEGVVTQDEVEIDDDVVIAQVREGDYVLASIAFQESEESREEKLSQLIQDVSKILEQKWMPQDRLTIEESFNTL